MNQIVVGMGEVLWDVLPEGRKLGGAPANFAFHVSQFGLDSRVVSAVGADELGSEIVENFREKGLNAMLEIVPYPTGTVQIVLDNLGVPCYEIREGVAWDNIPYTASLDILARQTRAVCFGSLAQRSAVSRATVNRFLDTMPDGEGQWKIFDINLRQNFYTREVLSASMQKCNVLKINDEELAVLSGMLSLSGDDILSLCRDIMQRYGLKILILTCGVRGSYVFSYIGRDVSFIGTPKVVVADTVGAGDSFTAAFTSALIRGLPIPDAHRLAVNVSAYVCTCQGAMPPLPEDLRSMRSDFGIGDWGTEEVVMGLSEL